MSSEGSVTVWLEALREDHSSAALRLWERYVERLVRLANRKLGGLPRRAADEHDLVAEVFADFLQGVREGRFKRMKDRPWTPHELAAVGGAQGIGVAFLEQTFGRQAPASCRPHREAARAVLDCLLPPFGSELKGQARTVEELRAASHYTNRRSFDELLQILDTELKLLTPFAPDKPDGLPTSEEAGDVGFRNRPESSYYQLTHDYLVPSVREWLTIDLRRSREGRATLRLRERAEDWNRHPEPRRLPAVTEWLAISWYVPRRAWTESQRRMMRAANRRLLGRVAVGTAVLLVLALVGWELQGRFQARALRGELSVADTARLPEIASRIPPFKRWVLPLLEAEYTAEFAATPDVPPTLDNDAYRRRLHLGLVLGQSDHKRLIAVLDPVTRIPPEDLRSVGQLLSTQRSAVTGPLGEKLAAAVRDEPAAVLPWAALCVAIAPEHPAFQDAADSISAQLVASRPLQFSVWLRLLEPIGPLLKQPLLAHWRAGTQMEGSHRAQLAEALVAYAATDAATLAEALLEARPKELPVLVVPLKSLGDAARSEMMNRWADWFPRPVSPPLASSLPEWDATLPTFLDSESVRGVVGQRGAVTLAVDQSAPEVCLERLASAGFRPVSWRPYRLNGKRWAAVGWWRDGREFRVVTGLPREQFEERQLRLAEEQFQPVDLAFEPPEFPESNAPLLWSGVWVRSEAVEPEVRCELAVDFQELTTRRRQLEADGFSLERFLAYVDADESHRYAAIWRRLDPPERERIQSERYRDSVETNIRVRYERHFGDVSPGSLQVDLRAQRITPGRRDTLVAHGDLLSIQSRTGPNRELTVAEEASLARVWQRMGKTGEVVRLREKALNSSGNAPESRLNLALALAADGQLEPLRAEIGRLETILPAEELEFLRFRAEILAGDLDAAALRRDQLESRTTPSARLDIVSANALLAALAESKQDPRAETSQRKALQLLREIVAAPEYLGVEILERAEWDGLRHTEEFQQLVEELKLARHVTGVWRVAAEPARSAINLDQSAADTLDAARQRLEEGGLPLVVEPHTTRDAAGVQFSSLWRHAIPSGKERLNAAERVAILALAMAQCGDARPLEHLLGGVQEQRDARSFVTEWLADSGYTLAELEKLLRTATEPQFRYAALLGLGRFPAEQASPELRATLSDWAAREPDAAVRAAAAWCLRRWNLAPNLAEKLSADVAPAADANWYRIGQGQIMVRLQPDDFRIGSPDYEAQRESTEQQSWMRIPRQFSLAETPVSVRQFRQFVQDPELKARLPDALYATLQTRNELTDRMWHLDCPQGSLRRLDAMLYCEWLSEQEGIPPDQRCYPDIWQFASKVESPGATLSIDEQRFGYRPAPSLLARRGYRLPTEAEFEYAARAGSQQSRFFGDEDELLDGYCWYEGNSNERSQPVGLLKPNDFGLFDILGNVSTHCQDPYAAYATPYASYLRIDNLDGGSSGLGNYVIRGGDFLSPPRDLRSARRQLTSSGNNRFTLGLRLARTDEPMSH